MINSWHTQQPTARVTQSWAPNAKRLCLRGIVHPWVKSGMRKHKTVQFTTSGEVAQALARPTRQQDCRATRAVSVAVARVAAVRRRGEIAGEHGKAALGGGGGGGGGGRPGDCAVERTTQFGKALRTGHEKRHKMRCVAECQFCTRMRDCCMHQHLCAVSHDVTCNAFRIVPWVCVCRCVLSPAGHRRDGSSSSSSGDSSGG